MAPRHGNNARMHPRNRYAFVQPDFEALARDHPTLAQYLVPAAKRGKRRRDDVRCTRVASIHPSIASSQANTRVIDFTNADAARALTQVVGTATC